MSEQLPELGEIVEAIGETVAALDTYQIAHSDMALATGETGRRMADAIARLRAVNDRITTGLEAYHAN